MNGNSRVAKYLIATCLLYFGITKIIFTQTPGLVVTGEVKEGKSRLNDAVIKVFKNGTAINEETSSNGKYSFLLDYDANYTIEYSKNGYITKRVAFNTSNVSEEEKLYEWDFPTVVSLFKRIEGVDYSILDKPIGKVYFEPGEGFIHDEQYTLSIQDQLEDLKDRYEEKVEEEEERIKQEAMAQEIAAAQAKEEEERKKREEEEAKKLAEEEAKRKAEEEERLRKEEEERKKREEELLAQQKLDNEAKRKVDEERKRKEEEERKRKRKEELLAQQKLDDEAKRKADEERLRKEEEERKRKEELLAQQKLDDEAKRKADEERKRKEEEKESKIETVRQKKEAKYNFLIAKADNAFEEGRLEFAKSNYEEALKYQPYEIYPKTKIKEINNQLNPHKENTDTPESPKNTINYPQGVTEETMEEKNKTIIKRIVVMDDQMDVYRKVIHAWGGIYYFKNGLSCDQFIWDSETEPQ